MNVVVSIGTSEAIFMFQQPEEIDRLCQELQDLKGRWVEHPEWKEANHRIVFVPNPNAPADKEKITIPATSHGGKSKEVA